MNRFHEFLRRVGIAMLVSSVLVGLIKYGPVEVKQGAVAALAAILGSVGTAVANHVRDDKTIAALSGPKENEQ